ncbi:MAG TPA: hypothetical protein VKX39_05365 [Bryobacteraceae bacterium]|nr:hypothetical protein [Bryobacteraceae bacterium]
MISDRAFAAQDNLLLNDAALADRTSFDVNRGVNEGQVLDPREMIQARDDRLPDLHVSGYVVYNVTITQFAVEQIDASKHRIIHERRSVLSRIVIKKPFNTDIFSSGPIDGFDQFNDIWRGSADDNCVL